MSEELHKAFNDKFDSWEEYGKELYKFLNKQLLIFKCYCPTCLEVRELLARRPDE